MRESRIKIIRRKRKAASKGSIAMFGLFKKSDKPKVDAAEIERQEREQRKKELAEQMRQSIKPEQQSQKSSQKA
jgi:hypothetical protein